MKIEISVVEHEGERLFKVGEVLFDVLSAELEFAGGKLSVIRNGETFDTTEQIDWFGTHAACVGFYGLKNLFGSGNARARFTPSLIPASFRVGDVIVVEMPDVPCYDFGNKLRTFACALDAARKVFKEKPDGIGLGEFRNRMSDEMVSTVGEFIHAPIVRFRSKK